MENFSEKSIVITLSDKDIDKLETMLKLLSEDGLKVTDSYEFGVIIGTIDNNDIIEKILKYPEVLSVTDEKISTI